MKLTRGKINKLYNKQKQTMKKYKNKKGFEKNKTFRNKKHLNLHKSTLKKLFGGIVAKPTINRSSIPINSSSSLSNRPRPISRQISRQISRPLSPISRSLSPSLNRSLSPSLNRPLSPSLNRPLSPSLNRPLSPSNRLSSRPSIMSKRPLPNRSMPKKSNYILPSPLIVHSPIAPVTSHFEKLTDTIDLPEPIITREVQQPIIPVQQPIIPVQQPIIPVQQNEKQEEYISPSIHSTTRENNPINNAIDYIANEIALKVTEKMNNMGTGINNTENQDSSLSFNTMVESMPTPLQIPTGMIQ